MNSIENIPLARMDGTTDTLAKYRGKVVLIVNVASMCGLTNQYDGLETLYKSKCPEGLEILAFPANNFKGQEPGTDEEISEFCSLNYGVTFPLYSKISVAGSNQHPLYSALTRAQPEAIGEGPFRERLKAKGIELNEQADVLWNFEKFLINRKGDVIGRFSPDVRVDDPRLVQALDAALRSN